MAESWRAPVPTRTASRPSPAQRKSVAGGQLKLRLHLLGGHAQFKSRGKTAGDSQPFGHELPMIAALVRPCESPAVTGVVAWRTVEAAQLVAVEVVVAGSETLSCPVEARESKGGVEAQVQLGIGARVGADRGITVQILRDERPMGRWFETSAETGEPRSPSAPTCRGCRAWVSVVVVAQRTD